MSRPDLYDEGYLDAYQELNEELKTLRNENEAMRGLIAANYRGMKEEIRKELATDHHTN